MPAVFPYTLIPGVGIEQLKLGESGEQAQQQFGDPVLKFTQDGSNRIHYMQYFSEGLEFYFAPTESDDPDLTLPIVEIRASGQYAGNTDLGIIIGSQQQQVRVIYGEPNFFDELLNQDQYSSGIYFCYDNEGFVQTIKVR